MVCPEFRGGENLDCYAVIGSGGQREQTRWAGQAWVSRGVSASGGGLACRGTEGGGPPETSGNPPEGTVVFHCNVNEGQKSAAVFNKNNIRGNCRLTEP